MVSWRDGWSNHEILSVTSVSPRSGKEALDARFVFAGLTLYDPLDVDTACLKIWYWAAEIFLLSPSSPSSSEMALLESGSIVAVKLTGDSSRVGDSTDEDLESGEHDLDSLDSLCCLTGVLACLTGVLACLSGALARLTKELMVLCGVWRNLSGDLGILSGVLAGVADLLLVESCLGGGAADWAGGQAGATGTLDWSIRRCNNVHIDINSTSISWLMDLGMEGKSGLLVPVDLETSGSPPGVVAAGVPSPADPSTPSVGWRAGPSASSGSSNCSSELWTDSTTETSAGSSLAGSSTVAWPSPVAGPSPVSEPSPVAGPLPVAVPLRVAEPSPVAKPLPAAGSAPAGPSATGAGTWTSGADSTWTCRAGEETTVIVLFSGGLELLGDSFTSRLVMYVWPVLSALSRLLSWWLGDDLRSGDARD